MSGTFKHSVNNYWSCDTVRIAPAVFMKIWMNFVNDHSGLNFIGYGTGKSSSGITPPSAWLDWDPLTTPTPPMADNSWFAFEAVNADNELNGEGKNPWQAKMQMTTWAGFDDCNVGDTDFGHEGETFTCCMRVCATGGWDNDTWLEFFPGTNEFPSDNHAVLDCSYDEKFVLDIVGDDDTIIWHGAAFDGTIAEVDTKGRFGYLGMLTRQSSSITYPFYFFSQEMKDDNYRCECYGASNFPGTRPSEDTNGMGESYSVWKDKTYTTNHRLEHWNGGDRIARSKDYVTDGETVLGCLLCAEDDTDSHYGILGELRLIGATGILYGNGVLVGENSDWKQICYNSGTYGGMLIKWPAGVAPLWP